MVAQLKETRDNTRLLYLESPSSIVFHLQDIRAVTAFARERGVTTVIDNSWASPYFQNPVELNGVLGLLL